jgi:hypothetical protein
MAEGVFQKLSKPWLDCRFVRSKDWRGFALEAGVSEENRAQRIFPSYAVLLGGEPVEE